MSGKWAESGEQVELSQDRGLARARSMEAKIAKLTQAGLAIAARLRGDERCYQQQAAVEAGISERSYYEYLQGEDEACKAFQALVLPAVYEQASKAEEQAERDIGCSEHGSGAWANWHKWKLEKRYRKIYGDLAQAPAKVEHTGKDGGPIKTDIGSLGVDELLALIEKTK